MKNVYEFFKKHYGKIFAGTLGTLIITLLGFAFSELRYAKAHEIKELSARVQALENSQTK